MLEGPVFGDSASVVERERRFELMYQVHYQATYNFVARRVISAQEAADCKRASLRNQERISRFHDQE
jgi:hypothetical protein